LVRTILLYFEFALLAALQLASLARAVIAVAPASAAHSQAVANEQYPAATKNPDMVLDFMASLPLSDAFKPAGHDPYQPIDQALFNDLRTSVTAHRFYTERKRGQRAMDELIKQLVPAFTAECAAKGGQIQRRGTEIFRMTLQKLNTDGGHELPEDNLIICTQSMAASLGALAIRSSFHTSTSLWVKDFKTYTVVTLHPRFMVTQGDLDRNRAAQQETERLARIAYAQRQAELERWRRNIQPGTETGCGPVLRVHGEMVELVYDQSREPKWYRRSELWPTRRTESGLLKC
jgi:hypothetical protein